MALNRFKCLGRPSVRVNSLPGDKKVINYGEIVLLRDSEITAEFEEKRRMGLFKDLGRIAKASIKTLKGVNPASKPEVSVDIRKATQKAIKEEVPGLLREAIKEEMPGLLKEVLTEALSDLPVSEVSKPAKRKAKPRKRAPMKKSGTTFIRPDAKEVQGDIKVEGDKTKDSSLNDAISKLRNKDGK